jgi:hypothetical protein
MDASSETIALLQRHIAFHDFRVFNTKFPDSLSSEFPECRTPKCQNVEIPLKRGINGSCSFSSNSPRDFALLHEVSLPYVPSLLLRNLTEVKLCAPSSRSDGYHSLALDLVAQICFSSLCTFLHASGCKTRRSRSHLSS